MQRYLTKEQIQEQIKVLSRNPKILTREQIRQRIQELAITNSPKKPKSALWGVL